MSSTTSRSSVMLGAGTGIGPAATININDAIFAPLVARQQFLARESDRQAVSNDTLVAVCDAYFRVQQARGELAGALEATRRTQELVEHTRKLALGLLPDLEVDRVVVELSRRQQAEVGARQRWQVASADLVRVLRLDPLSQLRAGGTARTARDAHRPVPPGGRTHPGGTDLSPRTGLPASPGPGYVGPVNAPRKSCAPWCRASC